MKKATDTENCGTCDKGKDCAVPAMTECDICEQYTAVQRNKDFWMTRNSIKKDLVLIGLRLKGMSSIEKLSVEEKIYLDQAIFWLSYLQTRHPVNDEKFLKQYPLEGK